MCKDTSGTGSKSPIIDSDSKSHDQMSEKERANVYTRQLFETYDEDILRKVLGDRYEERRKEYEALVETSESD